MGARRMISGAGRAASSVAHRLRPGAAEQVPGRRTVLDDLAMRRPWNLRVKAARRAASVRLGRLRPGVTVVIVNWNTVGITSDVVRAVQRFSPPGTEIMLIDNGSTDGSRAVFANWPGIETRFLRGNAGHGVALDLGVLWSRTTTTVTLDSDAIPLGEGWLQPAVEAIDDGALLAGLRSRRGFAHPVYLAVDTRFFVTHPLSFQVHRRPDGSGVDEWGHNAFDTGEVLSSEVPSDRIRLIDPTPNRAAGMTVDDVVYHHGGVSRGSDGGVTPDALRQWRDACAANGLDVPDQRAADQHAAADDAADQEESTR